MEIIPTMSIDEARKILWGLVADMNDEEIEQFITQCQRFASIIVDFAEKEAIK